MGTEVRLGLFDHDRLEYRFCTPHWRDARRAASLDALVSRARDVDPERCRRLTFADAPLAHPQFWDLVDECRRLGLAHFELETDGAPLTAETLGRLEEAGFERVFVIAGGMRQRVYETVMRDEDGGWFVADRFDV